ncbi:MAG: sensor histidine kinase [Bacteroidota bacterium]
MLGRIILRLAITTVAAIVFAYCWRWADFLATTEGLRDNWLLKSIHAVTVAVDYRQDRAVVDGMSITDSRTGEVVFSAGIQLGGQGAGQDPAHHQHYFTEGRSVMVGDRHLTVQIVRVGNDVGEMLEVVLADLFGDGGWLIGPFLVVVLGVSILTIRGTLRPLRRLSRMAESIGPAATNVRLPRDDVPREVMPLVLGINNALDRLEDGFRLQREFTADAAHELRTPLAVLMAHIDTLRDREIAAALRQDLDGMTRLVEQLLRIARVEALVVRPSDRASLADLARDVAVWLAPVAIRHDRTIEVEAPDQEVAVHGQEDALFHAIRNLADNALRYTPAGTTVTLTVLADPPTILVRDHGPGVPPEQRPMLFQRFWRGERQTAGTGLGLAIVQRTMQAHGGTVAVEDAVGGGAQFRLTFPYS